MPLIPPSISCKDYLLTCTVCGKMIGRGATVDECLANARETLAAQGGEIIPKPYNPEYKEVICGRCLYLGSR